MNRTAALPGSNSLSAGYSPPGLLSGLGLVRSVHASAPLGGGSDAVRLRRQRPQREERGDAHHGVERVQAGVAGVRGGRGGGARQGRFGLAIRAGERFTPYSG